MNDHEREEAEHFEEHIEYFREVLKVIHRIMSAHYGMKRVSVKPIGSGGSRLSIPVKIGGVSSKDEKVRYFGKILGSSDIMTARAIQVVKNIYLEMNSQDPMFGFAKSSEEMARHQYETMSAIYDTGVPTARPFGYHNINGILWLVVAEFLDARPINSVEEVTPEVMDQVFSYLRRLHNARIFHGDIKPDNIMLGDRIYILDVGRYLEEAPAHHKLAYDLACQIGSFLGYQSPEVILKAARKHYSTAEMRAAADYIDLIQKRIDFNFTLESRDQLMVLMKK
jgi:tRNA A-37 threonylcarbamoyl transferase component Bud32